MQTNLKKIAIDFKIFFASREIFYEEDEKEGKFFFKIEVCSETYTLSLNFCEHDSLSRFSENIFSCMRIIFLFLSAIEILNAA